jgi:hypothetical protein
MSERRFTLIDAMVMVAATAVGLAMARAYDPQFSGEPLPDFLKRGWGAPSCLMVALGLFLIPLRLWRPRLRPRDDLLEPGMAASYATGMAVVVSTILNFTHSIVMEGSLKRIARLEVFNSVSHQHRTLIPWAVLGAWLTLAAMGHWRPATSWIEWTGRVVALYWCLYPVLEVTASLIVRVIPIVH